MAQGWESTAETAFRANFADTAAFGDLGDKKHAIPHTQLLNAI